MAVIVSYSEIHGKPPSEREFSELISSFKTEPTFFSLAMWNLMLSLFERDFEKNKYLQGFFIHNLVRKDLQDRVFQLAALNSESPRPVFTRWQFLALMKKVLLETTSEGRRDPRNDDGARRTLGDACLMFSDLLFTEEQAERLKNKGGAEERERVHDELMAQWLFPFELLHPPNASQAVARNDEYFNIFDKRAAEFKFFNGQSLAQRFAQLTGLDIQQYLWLYFGIYALHINLQEKHPDEINENPGIINFDKERIFSMMDLSQEERDPFFQRVLIDLQSLIEGVRKDAKSGRPWQFDFTTFRNSPLVYNTAAKQGFTCIDFSFLTEKLASGVYHTILNSWAEDDSDRENFQRYWGKAFEQFVNDRLREEYPPSALANRFYANPFFHKKQSGSLPEVSDSVLDYGDSLVLKEHKGGYLSLDEKYSGDAAKLLTGVANKFGLNKAIKQLSRSIGKLFNADEKKRDIFSELGEGRRPIYTFSAEDVKRIRKVYPVLVVQDFSLTIGFINRRLKLQFEEMMRKYRIDPNVQVRPLSVITIEDLEDVLEHLAEVSLTEILDEYAREEHEPLSTFSGIFEKYLKDRGIRQRTYSWSLKRFEEIIEAIKKRFPTDK